MKVECRKRGDEECGFLKRAWSVVGNLKNGGYLMGIANSVQVGIKDCQAVLWMVVGCCSSMYDRISDNLMPLSPCAHKSLAIHFALVEVP